MEKLLESAKKELGEKQKERKDLVLANNASERLVQIILFDVENLYFKFFETYLRWFAKGIQDEIVDIKKENIRTEHITEVKKKELQEVFFFLLIPFFFLFRCESKPIEISICFYIF